jgi:hypothetical protein
VPDPELCGDAGAPSGGGDPWNTSTWTFSSTGTVGSEPYQNMIDGNVTTRWSSGKAQAGDEALTIDLGGITCLREIWLVSTESDFPVLYALDLSTDGVSYRTITKGAGSAVTKILIPSHQARYVRIRQLGTSLSWWSVQELAIKP